MNLKEAEAMVEKLLPEWSSTVSSNFDGFANLLLDESRGKLQVHGKRLGSLHRLVSFELA